MSQQHACYPTTIGPSGQANSHNPGASVRNKPQQRSGRGSTNKKDTADGFEHGHVSGFDNFVVVVWSPAQHPDAKLYSEIFSKLDPVYSSLDLERIGIKVALCRRQRGVAELFLDNHQVRTLPTKGVRMGAAQTVR